MAPCRKRLFTHRGWGDQRLAENLMTWWKVLPHTSHVVYGHRPGDQVGSPPCLV